MTPVSWTRSVVLAGCLVSLVACGKSSPEPDWRLKVIADAENKIRTRLGDPAAEFSRVQVTGDQTSGQTCGYVTAKPRAAANGGTGRFIVYIDGGPGYPPIEYSVGISTVSQAQFDFWWDHDCVGEGYKS
jgi:hypothetical protein